MVSIKEGWRYRESLPQRHHEEYDLQRRLMQGAETADLRKALKFYEDNRGFIDTLKEIFFEYPPIHIQAWRDLLDERKVEPRKPA